MRFYKQHWYYFSAVLFVILVFVMGFWGDNVSQLQKILIYNYMAILVHQFEEYILPGGFPYITNALVLREKDAPERYMLNKNVSFTINVIIAYPFFVSAIIFPNAIWLGFATILFSAGFETVVHAIVYPIRIKKFYYNPGLAATAFLGIPIGIYYIWYVTTKGLITGSDYLWGSLLVLAVALLMFLLMVPGFGFVSRDSKAPFTRDELSRGGFKKRCEEGQNR